MKVKIASTAKVAKYKFAGTETVSGHVSMANKNRIVAIGASTGGTEAIFEVVKRFKRDIPGVVIVQHMPPGFTKMYAERLNNQWREGWEMWCVRVMCFLHRAVCR